jgi:hypothetical protein
MFNRLSGKRRTFVWIALGYFAMLFGQAIATIVDLNFRAWAQKEGFDRLYELIPDIAGNVPTWLMTIWDFVTGDFGLGFVVGSFVFAFWEPLANLASWLTPGRSKRWPDFDKWDSRKEFKLSDAAYLWANIEPGGMPLPRRVKKHFQKLGDGIQSRVLKVHPTINHEVGMRGIVAKQSGTDLKPDPNWVLPREALYLYAVGESERPLFLFPEDRVPVRRKWWKLKAR